MTLLLAISFLGFVPSAALFVGRGAERQSGPISIAEVKTACVAEPEVPPDRSLWSGQLGENAGRDQWGSAASERERGRDQDQEDSHAGHLPNNLTYWSEWWHKLHQKELDKTRNSPLPPGPQILLGVMDIESDVFVRAVIRDTWMKQDGVCVAGLERPPPQCVVNVVFVLANESLKLDIEYRTDLLTSSIPPTLTGDILQFHFRENMNRGKSYSWFEHASRNFHWATHIGKVDTDMFPYLHKVVEKISRNDVEKCPLQYLGRQLHSHHCGSAMADIETETVGLADIQPSQAPPRKVNGTKVHYFTKNPESYCVVGGMYFLSRPLAEEITGEGSYFYKESGIRVGLQEDQATGRAVSEYARRTHNHIHTLNSSRSWSAFDS